MAISNSEFSNNIINLLVTRGLIRQQDLVQNIEAQFHIATAAIELLIDHPDKALRSLTPVPKGHPDVGHDNASCFMQELLVSNETLSGIAERHNISTLADCMYLLSALQKGSYIEVSSQTDSKILEVVVDLPSR